MNLVIILIVLSFTVTVNDDCMVMDVKMATLIHSLRNEGLCCSPGQRALITAVLVENRENINCIYPIPEIPSLLSQVSVFIYFTQDSIWFYFFHPF